MSDTISDSDFYALCERFRIAATAKHDDDAKARHSALPPAQITFEPGQKLMRVVRHDSQRTCVGFIALCDFSTKMLGNVKRGDLLKAAGWKQAAKRARGTVFANDAGVSCYGVFGGIG